MHESEWGRREGRKKEWGCQFAFFIRIDTESSDICLCLVKARGRRGEKKGERNIYFCDGGRLRLRA